MLEVCEAFLQQKHPDPIIDLEEEEENETLWNKVVELYTNVKAFLEVFWFDSHLDE
jgi:hypothetical protein